MSYGVLPYEESRLDEAGKAQTQPSDVDAIPPTMEWWEYVVLLPYLVFAGILVWYVSENYLLWDPEAEAWGLPKPVTGSLILAITWIAANFVIAGYYFIVMRHKLRKRVLKRGG